MTQDNLPVSNNLTQFERRGVVANVLDGDIVVSENSSRLFSLLF